MTAAVLSAVLMALFLFVVLVLFLAVVAVLMLEFFVLPVTVLLV